MLTNINSPDDLKKIAVDKLPDLASEIREELLEVVSGHGGHLAPNLGVVELTIALHYVFNAPLDKIIWDVGHQAYVHKILTGRREFFKTLRKMNGCAGFLSREESPYDCFGAGHAGTAISAALGMAAARDRSKGSEKVIAVVGDGSLNCGISLEGLNNICETTKDIILVLNDNKMSISQNVGGIPRYLSRLISGKSYNRFKAFAKMMLKKIPGGMEIRRKIQRLEEATKSIFVPGVFFEELGIRYVGPVHGHDIPELIRTLEGIKEFNRPVILHVITEKGHGYQPAATSPEDFHGLSAFNPATGKSNAVTKDGFSTFSAAFGETVSEIAEKNDNVAVITAAMKCGTGLKEFANKFPDKFYDSGIAEEHSIIFSAGLAAGGLKPIVVMYSTFLQRALDCVFHDVCLQNLPVIICTDRSGIVEDGPTHHGIHDLAFLRNMPNLNILMPCDENELRAMMLKSYEKNSPILIRYPKGGSNKHFDKSVQPSDIEWGKANIVKTGADLVIWAAGAEVSTAEKVSELLAANGINAAVVNTLFLKPFDETLLKEHASKMYVFSIEDCQTKGGLGSTIDEILINEKHHGVHHFGWGDEIIPHGPVKEIRKLKNFTPEAITEKIRNVISQS
ncbi:MAG: 1-deoxy-D-xylulose-5-phosphate synthase [Lentisphaerae bacterium GWF2_45_14]|nr:MAG: 1-deoxy-D-xylulose-5-phosphate synthase [Lentisphaerae bacterium GWF2_45_14]